MIANISSPLSEISGPLIEQNELVKNVTFVQQDLLDEIDNLTVRLKDLAQKNTELIEQVISLDQEFTTNEKIYAKKMNALRLKVSSAIPACGQFSSDHTLVKVTEKTAAITLEIEKSKMALASLKQQRSGHTHRYFVPVMPTIYMRTGLPTLGPSK